MPSTTSSSIVGITHACEISSFTAPWEEEKHSRHTDMRFQITPLNTAHTSVWEARANLNSTEGKGSRCRKFCISDSFSDCCGLDWASDNNGIYVIFSFSRTMTGLLLLLYFHCYNCKVNNSEANDYLLNSYHLLHHSTALETISLILGFRENLCKSRFQNNTWPLKQYKLITLFFQICSFIFPLNPRIIIINSLCHLKQFNNN